MSYSSGLPRLRGDGPLVRQLLSLSTRAAPPTRGWTHVKGVFWFASIGCPAYAGMDPLRGFT